MSEFYFHFLRPSWFFSLPLFLLFFYFILYKKERTNDLNKLCDAHLFSYMVKSKGISNKMGPVCLLFLVVLFMIIALAGPAWKKIELPTYHKIMPKVILLNTSQSMLKQNGNINDFELAKFKLHDLFDKPNLTQIGLLAYTEEPFLVSPLTEDAKTIDALLPSLTPQIMPIQGNNLKAALLESERIFTQAGFHQGQALILTNSAPTAQDISTAGELAKKGFFISIMPFGDTNDLSNVYQDLARKGKGQVLSSEKVQSLDTWLKKGKVVQFNKSQQGVSLFRDEGRWFVIPALLCLLFLFRKDLLAKVVL